jgi:hypothetical protein
MAYERRANLGGNNEPIVSIFTVKHLGGMTVCGLLMWMALKLFSVELVWWFRLCFIAAAVFGGLVLTFDFAGISLFDRVILAVGYWLRKPTGGTIVVPPTVAPVVRNERRSAPLLRNGEVVARPFLPKEVSNE